MSEWTLRDGCKVSEGPVPSIRPSLSKDEIWGEIQDSFVSILKSRVVLEGSVESISTASPNYNPGRVLRHLRVATERKCLILVVRVKVHLQPVEPLLYRDAQDRHIEDLLSQSRGLAGNDGSH